MSHKKEVVKMLSKTSIQAMYINRVKERDKLIAKYENLISRKAVGEFVDDELYETEYYIDSLYEHLEVLKLILEEDVPEVKSV